MLKAWRGILAAERVADMVVRIPAASILALVLAAAVGAQEPAGGARLFDDASRQQLKKIITDGVAAGRPQSVYIDFGGFSVRAKLTAASDEKLCVEVMDTALDLEWDKISDARLYRMAVKYAEAAAADGLMHLGLAARMLGKEEEASQFLEQAKQADAAVALRVEMLEAAMKAEE